MKNGSSHSVLSYKTTCHQFILSDHLLWLNHKEFYIKIMTWYVLVCRNWCKRNARSGPTREEEYTTYQGTTEMDIKLELWKKQWILTMWRNVTMWQYLMQIMSPQLISFWEPSLSSCTIPTLLLFKHVGSLVSLLISIGIFLAFVHRQRNWIVNVTYKLFINSQWYQHWHALFFHFCPTRFFSLSMLFLRCRIHSRQLDWLIFHGFRAY